MSQGKGCKENEGDRERGREGHPFFKNSTVCIANEYPSSQSSMLGYKEKCPVVQDQ